jgi:hypothetical protein
MGYIGQQYKNLSPEDRSTFDRWLKANAVAGLLIAGGLIAMALTGSMGSHDGTVANNNDAPKVIALHKTP